MTALIIEDDDSEREILRRGLSELGYSCTTAKNGKDGFLLFQRERRSTNRVSSSSSRKNARWTTRLIR